MSIEHKVQNETGRNPYRIGANVLLLVAFFLLFHPLLSRGSLMYQPTISHWLTAGAFVPLVLRPWRRNHPFAENHTRLYAAVLLVLCAVLIRLILKAADKLSAYIKCVEELKAGNSEFRDAAAQTRAALEEYELPEVTYFLETFMPSFSLTLDQLK